MWIPNNPKISHGGTTAQPRTTEGRNYYYAPFFAVIAVPLCEVI